METTDSYFPRGGKKTQEQHDHGEKTNVPHARITDGLKIEDLQVGKIIHLNF